MAEILIADDNESIREGLALWVTKWGFAPMVAASGRAALQAFRRAPADVVITDLKMDEVDGVALLSELRRLDPDVPVILITAFGTVEVAVEAMKLGAYDVLTKPLTPDVLRLRVQGALELSLARHAARRAEAVADCMARDHRRDLVAASPAMQPVLASIAKAAPTETTVFISGESGCGKELVATEIHARSRRAHGPFIKINCAAISDSLLESELFGHEKGAFTGAAKQKLGRFELAHGGTLFLDEIGDISAAMQAKLLRAIQERTIERVGGERSIKLDVRILSATHKSLEQEVARGAFRQDLYYRLVVLPIHVPPLRERREDIPLIIAQALAQLTPRIGRTVTIAPNALERLQTYAWPGNVRELINALEQAAVLCESGEITANDIPSPGARRPTLPTLRGERPLPELLEEVERELIVEALHSAGGVKAEAARLLGIKAPALYYKLEKYQLV